MSLPDADPGLFRNMYTARALRRLKPDPIPDDVLFQLFDAAIRAPSGQNVQDWRFIVIKSPEVKAKLQEWSMESWKRYQTRYAEHPELLDELPRTQRLSLRSVEHMVHNVGSAPAVVCVTGLKGRHSTPGGSVFPAVQNLLLTARALGLGGSIFNFPLAHREELMALLELPDTNEIYCLIPIGYPTDRHGKLRRKPVKQVVFIDRWQNTWPFAEEQSDDGWHSRWVPDE